TRASVSTNLDLISFLLSITLTLIFKSFEACLLSDCNYSRTWHLSGFDANYAALA
uniref:Uncharacterized protein n=1 Tax=Accipiter nisus TaxID=211598 RepID=A0A8B9MW38_9AVES